MEPFTRGIAAVAGIAAVPRVRAEDMATEE